MQAILWAVLSWVLRQVVIKFVAIGAVYALLVIVVPMAVGFITPFISTTSLTSLFNQVPKHAFEGQSFERVQAGLNLGVASLPERSLWACRFEHLDGESARTWVTEAVVGHP